MRELMMVLVECFFPYIKFDDEPRGWTRRVGGGQRGEGGRSCSTSSSKRLARSSISNKVNWKTLFDRRGNEEDRAEIRGVGFGLVGVS